MKKFMMAATVAATALLSACNNSMPGAQLGSTVDTLSYEIGYATSENVKGAMMQMQVDSAYVDEFLKGLKDGVMADDDKKKVAYYMGIIMGMQSNQQMLQGIERQVFGNDSTKELSRKNYLAGVVAGVKGEPAAILVDGKPITAQEAFNYATVAMDSLTTLNLERRYGKEKKANEDYLTKLAQQKDIKKLQDGVLYRVLKEGTGKIPADTATVVVKYEGRLINDTIFDTSANQENGVATFPVKRVIPGFSAALTHMPVGSEWEIFIPWNMAYGEEGQPQGGIPPFSTLIFKVTLVEIK